MKTNIGIDPGASGGIAWLFDDPAEARAEKMPATPRDMQTLLGIIREQSETSPRAALEKLGQMPRGKDGKAKQSGTTMFKMGRNFGHLEASLAAEAISFEKVLAATWQMEFGLKKKWASQTVKKNAHKAVAQQLFPALKITHATADALLIAEWLRRRELTDVLEETKELSE